MTTFAIGDVHGCSEEFEELCALLRMKHPNCHIIQLGDLIDRGPHLYKVFEVCFKYDVETLIGNHEMNFVREVMNLQPCRSSARKVNIDKFNEYSKDKQDAIVKYIKQSANYLIREGSFLSHAPAHRYGLKNLSSASVSAFCTRSDVCDYETDYADFPVKRFIHAHQHWNYIDITKQLKENRKVINIDSGLVYGGHLTAVNIKNLKQYYQVKAKKVYFEHQPRK